jgi:hypothetical protein
MNGRTCRITYSRLTGLMCAIVAALLVVANFWRPDDDLGILAMPFVAAAAVCEVRSYLVTMTEREVAAFNLGREVAAAESLPPVRSVT